MPYASPTRPTKKGSGHGARNHRVCSSKLNAFFWASFHVRWRPQATPPKSKRALERERTEAFVKKRKNKAKQ